MAVVKRRTSLNFWFSYLANWQIFWLACIGLLSFLLALPLLNVLSAIFSIDIEVLKRLFQIGLADYVGNSLLLMVGVGVLTLLFGTISAWLVTVYDFPGARLFEWALLLPLAIPAYIIAYIYTDMLSIGGTVSQWFIQFGSLQYGEGYWFPSLSPIVGAILVMSLVLYPYVYLLSRTAFLGQVSGILDVGRTLGYTRRRLFFKVALPLARPAIIGGVALVLMETLADYGTVQYFGIPVFTTGIFRTWFDLGEEEAARQLAILMMVFMAAVVMLEFSFRRCRRYYHVGSRHGRPIKKRLGGTSCFLAFAWCSTLFLAGFLLPVLYLFYLLLTNTKFFFDVQLFVLFQHTVMLAFVTAVLALIVASIFVYTHRVFRLRLTYWVLRVAGMGYAVPGTVIAIGVLVPFSTLDNWLDGLAQTHLGVSIGLTFSGTLALLIFAYLVRYLVVSLNTLESGFSGIAPSIDEVARTLRKNRLQILTQVHLPRLKTSLWVMVLLVFVDVLKELPATLILRPFNFNTLAVRTFELASDERLAEAALPALAIILAGLLPVIIVSCTSAKLKLSNV